MGAKKQKGTAEIIIGNILFDFINPNSITFEFNLHELQELALTKYNIKPDLAYRVLTTAYAGQFDGDRTGHFVLAEGQTVDDFIETLNISRRLHGFAPLEIVKQGLRER